MPHRITAFPQAGPEDHERRHGAAPQAAGDRNGRGPAARRGPREYPRQDLEKGRPATARQARPAPRHSGAAGRVHDPGARLPRLADRLADRRGRLHHDLGLPHDGRLRAPRRGRSHPLVRRALAAHVQAAHAAAGRHRPDHRRGLAAHPAPQPVDRGAGAGGRLGDLLAELAAGRRQRRLLRRQPRRLLAPAAPVVHVDAGAGLPAVAGSHGRVRGTRLAHAPVGPSRRGGGLRRAGGGLADMADDVGAPPMARSTSIPGPVSGSSPSAPRSPQRRRGCGRAAPECGGWRRGSAWAPSCSSAW